MGTDKITAKVEWGTKLGSTAQSLLAAHNAQFDARSVQDLADELTIGEVRDVFKQVDDEFYRLEQMKQAMISMKDQLNRAIRG